MKSCMSDVCISFEDTSDDSSRSVAVGSLVIGNIIVTVETDGSDLGQFVRHQGHVHSMQVAMSAIVLDQL